jgi:carbon starvation protein CstA
MEHSHRVAEGAPWFFPLLATMGFVFLLLGTFYYFRASVLPVDMTIALDNFLPEEVWIQ